MKQSIIISDYSDECVEEVRVEPVRSMPSLRQELVAVATDARRRRELQEELENATGSDRDRIRLLLRHAKDIQTWSE